MLIYSIVYGKKYDKIIEKLDEIKHVLELKGIELGFSEAIEDNNHFIKIYCCNEDEVERGKKLFNIYFSAYISKLIIEKYIEKEVDKLFKDMYFFLKGKDIHNVKEEIEKVLLREETVRDEDFVYFMNIKNEMDESVKKSLMEYEDINIEGFLTFRMKDFKKNIELIIDKIVEKYMVKKEYDEFIRLLRYFVEIQECKIDEVNIIIDNDGKYSILDKSGRDILSDFLKDVDSYKIPGSISVDDVIISGLITNVPKRVVIHGSNYCQNEELIDTIKNVFLERVAFCEGCVLCVEDIEKYKAEEYKKYSELNLE